MLLYLVFNSFVAEKLISQAKGESFELLFSSAPLKALEQSVSFFFKVLKNEKKTLSFRMRSVENCY